MGPTSGIGANGFSRPENGDEDLRESVLLVCYGDHVCASDKKVIIANQICFYLQGVMQCSR